MTWRGSVDFKDRFFAALVYALPLVYVLPFGDFLISQTQQIPILGIIIGIIYLPLQPLISIYYSFPFAGIIIFFALFFAVVRNERISHFIRFNTMQAILIDILLVLCRWVMLIFERGLGGNNLLIVTLYNVIFLGTLAACLYSIIQSATGRYAEIPTISEAAYSQVR